MGCIVYKNFKDEPEIVRKETEKSPNSSPNNPSYDKHIMDTYNNEEYYKHVSLPNIPARAHDNPQVPCTEKKIIIPSNAVERRIRAKYSNGPLTPIIERNVREETTTNHSFDDSRYMSQSNSMMGRDDEWSRHSHLSSIIRERNVTLQHTKENIYEIILKSCAKENAQFNDSDFKHEPCYIGEGSSETWVSIKNVFANTSLSVFNGIPSHRYMRPGSLSSSYFMISVHAIISKYPLIVQNMFLSKEYSVYGLYAINVPQNGDLGTITMDDYVPFKEGASKYCFAYSSKNYEIWLTLLEKCWAKINKSYYKISKIEPLYVFKYFFGCPCEHILLSEERFLERNWHLLCENTVGNIYIIAVTKESALHKSKGLESYHAYRVIQCHELHGKDRILQIKNLWGSRSWNGDYSATSNKWDNVSLTPNIIRDEPGSFWMSYTDFCQHFESICINKAQNGYYYKGVKLRSTKREAILRMKISNLTHMYLSLTQGSIENATNEKYSPVLIILIRHFHNKLEYKTSKWKQGFDCWFECKLEKGEYFIYCETDWVGQPLELVMNAYSSNELLLDEMELMDKDKLIKIVFASCAKQIGDKHDYSAKMEPKCFLYTGTIESYTFYYYENLSPDSFFEELLEFKEMWNSKLVKEEDTHIKLKPGDSYLVLIKHIECSVASRVECNRRTMVKLSIDNIKSRIKEEGVKEELLDRGQKTNIFLYSFSYSGGVTYFYENNSNNITLMKSIEFKFKNIEPIDDENTKINFVLKPGETKTLNFTALAPDADITKIEEKKYKYTT